jgi:hypothetical protein
MSTSVRSSNWCFVCLTSLDFLSPDTIFALPADGETCDPEVVRDIVDNQGAEAGVKHKGDYQRHPYEVCSILQRGLNDWGPKDDVSLISKECSKTKLRNQTCG